MSCCSFTYFCRIFFNDLYPEITDSIPWLAVKWLHRAPKQPPANIAISLPCVIPPSPISGSTKLFPMRILIATPVLMPAIHPVRFFLEFLVAFSPDTAHRFDGFIGWNHVCNACKCHVCGNQAFPAPNRIPLHARHLYKTTSYRSQTSLNSQALS